MKKIFILLFAVSLFSCADNTKKPEEQKSTKPAVVENDILSGKDNSKIVTPALKIANPASVFCVEQGGKLSILDTKEGQTGYCTFDDKSECEEWAFFRGECKKGQIKQ